MRCSTVSATVPNGWKTSGKVAFFLGNWIAENSGFQVDGTFFTAEGGKGLVLRRVHFLRIRVNQAVLENSWVISSRQKPLGTHPAAKTCFFSIERF